MNEGSAEDEIRHQLPKAPLDAHISPFIISFTYSTMKCGRLLSIQLSGRTALTLMSYHSISWNNCEMFPAIYG